jgi:hypothetical protein
MFRTYLLLSLKKILVDVKQFAREWLEKYPQLVKGGPLKRVPFRGWHTNEP